MKTKCIALAALILLGVSGCQKIELDQSSVQSEKDLTNLFVKADPDIALNFNYLKGAPVNNWFASINEALAEYNIQLVKAETYGAEQEGMILIFKDVGNKQLPEDYVPNDPRNYGGIDIPYIIDGTELGTSSGMSEGETLNAIMSAMSTWDNNSCARGLNIPYWGTTTYDLGFTQYLFGFGGLGGFFPGVITHAGILPPSFFDLLQPNGGEYILGVTFTFVWSDGFNPTDIDNNGKSDVAIKETYINDYFNWQDAPDDLIGNGIFDFETVVLHETGHALSQGHFGKAFVAADGYLHFAPYALMNSGYTIGNRELTETDLAGHCSNWSSWPRR
jgi:hypothetical protein